jgi:hypothetical protein
MGAKLNASNRFCARNFMNGKGRKRTVARDMIFLAVIEIDSHSISELLLLLASIVVGMRQARCVIFVIGVRLWPEGILRVLTLFTFKENNGLITFKSAQMQLISQPAVFMFTIAPIPILTTVMTCRLFLR